MPRYVAGATPQNFVNKYAIYTSDDGSTWTARTSPLDIAGSAGQFCNCVAYDRSTRLVAAGSGGSITVAGLIPIITSDDGGLTWTARSSPFDNVGTGTPGQVNGVCNDHGVWMAVGTHGGLGNPMVCTSPDGISWTQVTAPNIRKPMCVIYAAGYWWVGGQSGTGFHCLAKSNDDGATWTSVSNQFFDGSSSAGQIYCLGYNGSQFVAGGYQGTSLRSVTVQTSPDGATWTAQSCPFDKQAGQPQGGTFSGVVWSPALGLWVGSGLNQPSAGNRTIISSPDGVTWTTRSAALGASITGDIWDGPNGKFFSVGGSIIQTSTDGVSWSTALSSSAVQGFNAIAFAPPPVTLSEAGAIASSGALRLSVQKALAGAVTSKGVPRIRHLMVAVGQDSIGGKLETSPDGVTWTARTTPLDGAGQDIWGVAYDGVGLWVAVGNHNTTGQRRIITSPDGITWTGRASALDSGGEGLAVCYDKGNSLWVVVGNNGFSSPFILTSPNGITWTSRTPASADELDCVCSNGSIIVIGGSASAPLQTSTDGVNWTARTSPLTYVYGIAWSTELGLFVAVGQTQSGTTFGANTIMTSPDGITWTLRSNPMNNPATFGAAFGYDVCWSPELGLFCVLGRHQPVNPCVMTSPDGITWTERTTSIGSGNSNIGGMTWNGERFVASYQGQVATSDDGVTWTNRTNALDYIRFIGAGVSPPVHIPVTRTISLSGSVTPHGAVRMGDKIGVVPGMIYIGSSSP